jgi:hypothetical protein
MTYYRYFRRVEQGWELTRETPDLRDLEGDESRIEECTPTITRILVGLED